jgi:lysophospholipase L1-like esterase
LELTAGYVWQQKYHAWLVGQLHGYDRVDFDRSIVLPIPNTVMTVGQYRQELKAHQKPLGLEYFERSLADEVLPDSAVLFTINQYGFKGPEFEIPKPPRMIRILAIGDSCTWGPPDDRFSYPRLLERELSKRMTGDNLAVEVINAGVPGSSFEKAVKRIGDFDRIDPDIVTIYLGWNGTIGRADPAKLSFLYRYSAFYKVFYHLVQNRTDTGLSETGTHRVFYDDSLSNAYQEITFEYDLLDLDALVRSFKLRNPNVEVELITLAGMFDWRVQPDEKALRHAYPISSSDNLYAYAVVTRKFNEALRIYAKTHDLGLIDFEEYAWEKLRPRSQFFDDSVHPSLQGYREMANFLTEQLWSVIHRASGNPAVTR